MPATERWLQEQVRALCAGLGIAVQHLEDSRRSWLPGFPDLEIIGTRIIWRELKREHETLTREQTTVGYRIRAAGGDFAVWRPSDLYSGQIARELTAISKLGKDAHERRTVELPVLEDPGLRRACQGVHRGYRQVREDHRLVRVRRYLSSPRGWLWR